MELELTSYKMKNIKCQIKGCSNNIAFIKVYRTLIYDEINKSVTLRLSARNHYFSMFYSDKEITYKSRKISIWASFIRHYIASISPNKESLLCIQHKAMYKLKE